MILVKFENADNNCNADQQKQCAFAFVLSVEEKCMNILAARISLSI